MEMLLPKDVVTIINQLRENGYDAYAVGGCVRDSILGNTPDDWDITTSAKPLQIKKIFKRTVDTGIKHGTVTVLLGKNNYEVTTYRIDGEYQDNRHPKEVTFTTDLLEDLKRRDFTINAMAYNPYQGLIDAFGGMEDLQNKTIRCVGNPVERFTEDALRILRAVRFSAQLDFTIEKGTREAITNLAHSLVHISAERIQTELMKLLISPNPYQLKTAYELGITKVVLPEFDAMMETPRNPSYGNISVGEHALHTLSYVEANKIIRLSLLLQDVGIIDALYANENDEKNRDQLREKGAQIATTICKRLKLDNNTLEKVTKIVRWHDYAITLTEQGVRRGIHTVGEEIFPYLFAVQRADWQAGCHLDKEERLRSLDEAEELYREVIRKGQCVSLKTLQITGKDLIALGIKPGKDMGNILNEMLDRVLDNANLNQKETLLAVVKNTYGTMLHSSK